MTAASGQEIRPERLELPTSRYCVLAGKIAGLMPGDVPALL